MSKDKRPNDYEVGYGKPPKHAQFKPGQSGNPRGPKPKLPRAEIESQIGKDVRRVLRNTLVVNGKEITFLEALIVKAVHSGLAGNQGNLRLALNLARTAYRENVERKPELQMIDGIDFDRILRTPWARRIWLPYLKELAKLSREP